MPVEEEKPQLWLLDVLVSHFLVQGETFLSGLESHLADFFVLQHGVHDITQFLNAIQDLVQA